MNILITSAGRRVSLVRAFQKEIKKYFPDGKIYTTDVNPKLSSACQVADGSFKVNKVTDGRYIDYLIRLCIDNNIKVIIPTIDTELIPLVSNRDRFADIGVHCLVSEEKLVGACRNKRLTHKLFEKYNVPFAKEFLHDAPQFPLFIKPIDGSSSKGLYFIEDESQLTQDLIET